MSKKKLLICITSHGFGHFSMTVPIINQLLRENKFDVVLRTTIPDFLIETRLEHPVEIIKEASDFGMVMDSSLDTDVDKSLQLYANLHDNWDEEVNKEVERLSRIAPDVILANIPYLTLAAADKLGIPSLAYCSLNWADITLSYFKEYKKFVDTYIPQMLEAYNSAQEFICPSPAMAMPKLNNTVKVGPICSIGQSQKSNILNQLNLSQTSRLILISAGGVLTPIPVESWPELPGIVWISTWEVKTDRKDIIWHKRIDASYTDLMASADLIISKPGYGTVSESVCHGKPAIFVRRGDWAEEPFLADWWQSEGLVREISRDALYAGDFIDTVHELIDQPQPHTRDPEGVFQAIEIINKYL